MKEYKGWFLKEFTLLRLFEQRFKEAAIFCEYGGNWKQGMVL